MHLILKLHLNHSFYLQEYLKMFVDILLADKERENKEHCYDVTLCLCYLSSVVYQKKASV